MKTRLQARNRIPYGGMWRVVDPLSGQAFQAVTFDRLLEVVKAGRRANGLPIGLDFEAEIEALCCANYPAECENVDPDMPRKRKLALEDVVRGTATLMAFKLAGSPLVEVEEAEQRAAICARCPMQVSPTRPCSACEAVKRAVIAAIGNKVTSQDERLHSCGICQCFNAAQVWVPLDILYKSVSEDMAREFGKAHELWGCWKVVVDQGQAKE